MVEELTKTKQEAWLPCLVQQKKVTAAKKVMVLADTTLKVSNCVACSGDERWW